MGHCMSAPTDQVGNKYEKKSSRATDEMGKTKFIGCRFGIVGQLLDSEGQQYRLIVFVPTEDSLQFSLMRESSVWTVWTASFTDEAFAQTRTVQCPSLSAPAVFKSIASDIAKGKVKCSVSPNGAIATVVFQITAPAKEIKLTQALSIELSSGNAVSLMNAMTMPLIRIAQHKRTATEANELEKEFHASRLQVNTAVLQGKILTSRMYLDEHMPFVTPLREDAVVASKLAIETVSRIQRAERQLRKAALRSCPQKPVLDVIYDRGGAVPFSHCDDAEEHVPQQMADSTPFDNNKLLDYVKRIVPQKVPSMRLDHTIAACPVDPHLAQMFRGLGEHNDHAALRALSNLDQWDYNVFEADRSTGNNALFYTTYAILYKLDLVNYFNIDDQVLRNFLGALQSGYHPNPYHNATHAADVTQINYFIITTGGLAERCQLSKEDLLGAMIAGAIHDYDHPGFNNNFHTRTNAYLSTLYNDRSILENHHCACVSEILKLPKYNIFASLTNEQRLEVRDIMLEMVLATDMGNHAKIFSSFRRRLTESTEWHGRRDDTRLALSMSIKMADISNCGRPNSLYVEWAKNIALEFYNQGDVEAKLKLPISPFMDRRKDKADFPKGQTSFMNYIVQPMLEALAEFLPPMEFTLQHCHENKDYWQKQSE